MAPRGQRRTKCNRRDRPATRESAAVGSIRPSYSARPMITPSIPSEATAASEARSFSEATPPEAITGSRTARAMASVASRFTPPSMPSRSMSV